MSIKKEWFAPFITPLVPMGTESLFWLAIESNYCGKSRSFVRLAHYQNRPLELDDGGESTSDDHLVNTDGEPLESIGWVNVNEHYDFEDYYSKIEFNDEYKLVAWAYVHTPDYPKTFPRDIK